MTKYEIIAHKCPVLNLYYRNVNSAPVLEVLVLVANPDSLEPEPCRLMCNEYNKNDKKTKKCGLNDEDCFYNTGWKTL